MAKKDKTKVAADAATDTGSDAPVAVATSTPVETLTEPGGGSRELARSGSGPTVWALPGSDTVADAALVPLRVARRVLPERRLPVALGVSALVLVGALELPAAVGVGLGWEALRRWGPAETLPR